MRPIEWNDSLLHQAHALCRIAHTCASRGWVPATAGNFSFRTPTSDSFLITASGLDKGSVTPDHLLEISLSAPVPANFILAGTPPDARPSAETSLHRVVYLRDPKVKAILHVHTPANTLLSDHFATTATETSYLPLTNYELLKALSGVTTHEHLETIPILENSQDYASLSGNLDRVLAAYPAAHAFLLRRHGIYTWGDSIADAWRHLEALEFLFEVEARRHFPASPSA